MAFDCDFVADKKTKNGYRYTMKKQYDVIIIGKGPAGISASLYIARAKRSVLVLGKDFGALAKAATIENYYGFAKPITGLALAEAGVEQARFFGVLVETAEVTGLEILYPEETSADSENTAPARFKVKTGTGEEYMANTVLITVGRQRTGLKVSGFEEYQGRGISFCAVCDGFFYRNKKVGIIGNGAYAATELNHLYHLTKDVSLFTNGKDLEAGTKELLPPDIPIITEIITAITGTAPAEEGGVVASVQTASKVDNSIEEHPTQGLFVAIGTAGASDFAAKLGLTLGTGVDVGTLVTDKNGATAIPGIYSAGDATGGYMQIAKAVSDGAHASKAIIAELRKR